MNDRTLLIMIPSEVATVGLTATLSSRAAFHVVAIAHSLPDGLAALRRRAPEIAIVCPEWLAAVGDVLVKEGLRCKVVAFGSKPHLGASAAPAARTACGYVSYFTPSRAYLPLLDGVSECGRSALNAEATQCRNCPVRPTLVPPQPRLTAREMEVFVAIGSGFSASEIAAGMGISVKTIESHRESIRSKLATDSAWQLNAMAADWCRGGRS